MTPILLNQLRNQITSSLISLFCKKYDENENLLKKAIETSFCTVLIGLNTIIEETSSFENIVESVTLSEFYKTLEYDNGKVSSINYSFEQEGFEPLHLIFLNKKERISEMISNEIGIKSETAVAVLNFAVMLMLSHFQNAKTQKSAIQDYINTEKKIILSTVPEGIRIILGYFNFECEETNQNSEAVSHFRPTFLSKIFKF